MAGIDPEKGATMQQIAQMQTLDPDFANKIYEQMMADRQANLSREDEQQFTGGQNDLTRQAEAGRQAALFGQQDKTASTLATTQETAAIADDTRTEQQKIADDARAAEEAKRKEAAEAEGKVAAINTESAAKVAEAERLGLVKGSPEYQKFVFDISPSAGTTITTNVGGGKKLDETLDTEEGKIWTGHQRERNVAAGSQKDMAMLDELTKMAPQGPIMGNLASIPYLQGFSNAGVAFNSIVKRVAPTLRVEGSGSTSDIEYQGMLDSLPALGNYPEANRLIIGMMQAKSAINIERGNTVDAYRNGEITDIQARQKLAEINSRSISNPELEALFQKIGPTATDTGGTDTGGFTIKKKGT
jgi:hypothetical protein